jgi:hypothetical protein
LGRASPLPLCCKIRLRSTATFKQGKAAVNFSTAAL